MSPVISTLLPVGLAFIMFALGLKLSVADFRRDGGCLVAIQIGNDGQCASFRKGEGGRAADALAAAGDDGDAAVQPADAGTGRCVRHE